MKSRFVPLFLASAAAAASCREPTQVTVSLTTDLACTELAGASITPGKLGGFDEAPIATSTRACKEASPLRQIGTIVLFPSGESDSSFALQVVAGVDVPVESCTPPDYRGCIVARRAMRYAPHTPLELPIVLREICKDVVCDPASTCVQGGCVTATVPDPEDCPGGRCTEEQLGDPVKPTPREGGAPDGEPDSGPPADSGAGGTSPVPAPDAAPPTDGGSGGTGGGPPTQDAGPDGSIPDGSIPEASIPDAGAEAVARDATSDVAAGRIPDASSPTDAGAEAAAPLACASPAADCNGLASDGCETDLSSDPLHCGVCTRICPGTACTAGACGAAVLAGGVAEPSAVAATETHVFWTSSSGNSVTGVRLSDGATTVSLSGEANAYTVAADATHVYWAGNQATSAIRRAPVDGGPAETVVAAQTWPTRIALGPSHVYFVRHLSSGAVLRAPKGAGQTPEVLASGLDWPMGIATSPDHVYFVTWVTAGTVLRVPVQGGAPAEPLPAATLRSPFAVAVHGDSVVATS
ncbi:MAG: hypothetical protein FJ104_07175, partial [Deltaproteobacteria bacterium]|nr:hypothetical protein [Deltaproteobacteria bacterium]